MGLAVISDNTSIKISSGGSFIITTTGSTNIVTTAANQYAKVNIAGAINQTSGSGSTLKLFIGANSIKSVQLGAAGLSASLHDLASVASSGLAFETFELIVPPSSTLSSEYINSGTSNASVSGSYVVFQNTP